MTRYETALKFFNEQKHQTDLRINAGIENNRKGNAEIIFEGENLPSDITAEVELKNHEFKFGANIFMLDEFESEEKNKIYREKFPEIFNLATVPFYWADLEPIEGSPRYAKNSPRVYRRPAPDLCVEYCKENNIEPKCHCLNYETFSPSWLKNAPVYEVKQKLEKRFSEISERYGSDIPSFEVTNETLQLSHENATHFFESEDFAEWSFRTADRYFSKNRLIINDYNIWSPILNNRASYYMQIERLLKNGSRIDSVGMQFHSFFPLEDESERAKTVYNPEMLFKMLDLYQQFGIAEQITEMTIPAYGDDAENEEIQSLLTQNLYKLFFSHPATEAVIYWNLVDGYAHCAQPGDMTRGENIYYGGMLRHDMSEKPVYKALKNLIHNEWHTHEVIKVSDNKANFRGFYGDYRLKFLVGDKEIVKEFKLSKTANNKITINI